MRAQICQSPRATHENRGKNRFIDLYVFGDEDFSVEGLRAEFFQRLAMEERSVAFVPVQMILRKLVTELYHEPVAMDFGEDRGGGDRE